MPTDQLAEEVRPSQVADGPAVPIQAVRLRHPGRWVSVIVVLLIAEQIARSLATNSRFEWHIVAHYFFSREILQGLQTTLELTAAAMAIAVAGGAALAVMRISPNWLLSRASWVYTWFFRGTPVLVQLLFWFNIQALYPKINFGLGIGPSLSFQANSLITPMVAAVVGLGLNEAAYMGEIVRAGILAVDEGQTDAAHALGMSRMQTMRRIILPQAMRVIIPPTANETIGMLKTSSLASVITVTELLFSAQLIYSINYRTIQLLIVASFWYLIVTTVLSIGQYYLERRFARGTRGSGTRRGFAETWRRTLSMRRSTAAGGPNGGR
jgi:polar amino acid transport system permease protein